MRTQRNTIILPICLRDSDIQQIAPINGLFNLKAGNDSLPKNIRNWIFLESTQLTSTTVCKLVRFVRLSSRIHKPSDVNRYSLCEVNQWGVVTHVVKYRIRTTVHESHKLHAGSNSMDSAMHHALRTISNQIIHKGIYMTKRCELYYFPAAICFYDYEEDRSIESKAALVSDSPSQMARQNEYTAKCDVDDPSGWREISMRAAWVELFRSFPTKSSRQLAGSDFKTTAGAVVEMTVTGICETCRLCERR